MKNKVTLIENALDPKSWETFDCGDVRAFLKERYPTWPANARIYFNHVCESANVTPFDEAGVDKLGKLYGHFFLVIYPESLAVIAIIVAIVSFAATLVLNFLLRPSLPENQQNQSPNNSLTARENRERLGGRIPDIYGTLWAYPDLIMYPYRIFIGNKEVEYMYMCLGRGDYEVADVDNDIRDDVTPISQIDGASCEIYAPFTSPNSGDDPSQAGGPKYSVGNPIRTPIKCVRPYLSINGQVLHAPNTMSLKGSLNIRFTDDGTVEGKSEVDFTEYFTAGTEANPKYLVIGDGSTIMGFSWPCAYKGTYLILDVAPQVITLSDPGSVNAAWNSISGETAYMSPVLSLSGDTWEGPIKILDNTITEVWCNFVALQGCYEIDSDGNQKALDVLCQIEITSLDAAGEPQGSPIYYAARLRGSNTMRSMVGVTLKAMLPFAGGCQIRGRRTTNTDLRDGYNVVDEVQWRDLYAVSPVTETDFGNVTTVQTVTWPTPQALTLKKRKINILVNADLVTKNDPSGGGFSWLEELPSLTVSVSGNTMPWDPKKAGNPGFGVDEHLGGPPGYNNITSHSQWGYYDPITKTYDTNYTPTFQGHGCLYPINTTIYKYNDIEKKLGPGDKIWVELIWINETWAGVGEHNFDTFGNVMLGAEGDYPDPGGTLGSMVGAWVDGDGKVIGLPFTMAKSNENAWYEVPSVSDGGSNIKYLFAGMNDHWYSDNGGFWVFNIHGYKVYTLGAAGGIISNPISKNAADILIAMALDPMIGRMQLDELDIEGIYAAMSEAEAYFGTPLCCEFSHTFDDPKTSFEEMVAQLAQAVMCTAYRRGKVLSWMFEKATENSSLLFNHRNKIPGTEQRNVSFGSASENDGIDIDYVEPNAPGSPRQDSQMTLHFPDDESALAPRKVTAVGVRNQVQAWILGWRMYNKLLYQNTMTEFTATAEAALAIINERLLIADNTRPETQDGEILEQAGLEITLSQPAVMEEVSPPLNYTIFIQHYDQTVEAIAITPGSAPNKVVLAQAPSIPLVLDPEQYARTTYIIVDDVERPGSAFLLAEKVAKPGGQFELKAINYDERYYEHDQDYRTSPPMVDAMTPGTAHAGGYLKQAQITVPIDAKCLPWDPVLNPAYPYGKRQGKGPVVVPIQTAAGGNVLINATPGWLANVDREEGHAWFEADGEQGHITGADPDINDNGYFPTKYCTSPALGHGGLMGAWAKYNGGTGNYDVIQPFVIGLGGTFVVPAGDVDTILLGINDTVHGDNDGAFQATIIQITDAAGDAAGEESTPDQTTTDPNETLITFTVNGA